MILQFGKLPPPIGGISIHLERLMDALRRDGMKVEILDYSRENRLDSILAKLNGARIVHIHISRKGIRLLFVILFKLLFKKVIITIHGEYNSSNIFDNLSIYFCDNTILENEKSYSKAMKLNRNNIYKIGAFIAPSIINQRKLTEETKKLIEEFKDKYKNIYCTNAWNVSFDRHGNEIYNGSLLVSIFARNNNIGLFFSDPEGKYKMFLEKKFGRLPQNICFINYDNSFLEVIKQTDALIRSTTTDGDSLSVKEALFLQKDVITSDIVDRPKGSIIYKLNSELESILLNFENYKGKYFEAEIKDHSKEIIELYKRINSNNSLD